MLKPRTGLLIVGHGTRSERGLAEFREVIELVARWSPGVPVEGCCLELARPTSAEGLERLVARRCERIVVLPLLLFAAGHAKEDIPAAVQAAAQSCPQLEVALAEHLGCHERILQLSAQRYEAAASLDEEVAAQDTLWLMVGRGSRDASALAEMQRFIAGRLRLTPVGQVRVAYLAMAEPALATILPQIAELRFRRVVVQPHLLFHGDLLISLEAAVAAMAAQWPHQQWHLTPHLGVSDLLAEALWDRFLECESCDSPLGR